MTVQSEELRSDQPQHQAAITGSRARWLYLAGGVLAIVIYFVNPRLGDLPSWAPRYPLGVGLDASAVIALVVGIRRYRPAYPLPWWLMVAGQALYTVGDVILYWNRYVREDASFPTLADAFYLGRVPLLVAALVLIIRRRRRHDQAAVIDTLIVGVAAGLSAWIFILEPSTQASLPTVAMLVALAYPVIDLMIVALAARLLIGGGHRAPAFYLLTGALLLLAASDLVYSWFGVQGTIFSPGNPIEAGWFIYYLMIGAAALHPSMRTLAARAESEQRTSSWRRLTVLWAAAVVAPVLLASEAMRDQPPHSLAIAGCSIVLFSLVVLRLAGVMRDQRRAQNALEDANGRLQEMTTTDTLTGLPNRALFTDRVNQVISSALRDGREVPVMLIDLDHFKEVNDTVGHHAGDELLIDVARRLLSALRTSDTVARIGGDEFAVVLEMSTTGEQAAATAERVLEAVRAASFVRDGVELIVSASIGIALWSEAGTSQAELLKHADVAMYRAKAAGGDRFEMFQPAMTVVARNRLGLERDLRRAITSDELFLRYQPQIDLATGEVLAVEALVRWTHPTRGEVMPAEFISLAEESGLIVPLGAWVLNEACRQLAHWHDDHPPGPRLRMSVNVSARQLADARFVTLVTEALARSGVSPASLELEITESTLVDESGPATTMLRTLRALGVSVAIDDFGTGYSSLAYLRRFPVDRLKLDMSFVAGLEHADSGSPGSDEALVGAAINLGHALRLDVLAEGVETEKQRRALIAFGCDQAHGYLLAKPLRGDELEVWMAGDHGPIPAPSATA
jgi:diguanylate cyclase (GGDEF)-like protein